MYPGEYDACVVTLSAYPHRASLKNMLDQGGNRTYDLWNTSPMLFQLSYVVWSVRVSDISVPKYHLLNRPDRVAQLEEHSASIPKVVGSIPTVVRHIFQACPVWIYTQSNITSMILVMSNKYRKSLLKNQFHLPIHSARSHSW